MNAEARNRKARAANNPPSNGMKSVKSPEDPEILAQHAEEIEANARLQAEQLRAEYEQEERGPSQEPSGTVSNDTAKGFIALGIMTLAAVLGGVAGALKWLLQAVWVGMAGKWLFGTVWNATSAAVHSALSREVLKTIAAAALISAVAIVGYAAATGFAFVAPGTHAALAVAAAILETGNLAIVITTVTTVVYAAAMAVVLIASSIYEKFTGHPFDAKGLLAWRTVRKATA